MFLQASRHHYALLSSKSLWISIAKRWDYAGKPLPLPVHLTDATLTAAAVRAAVRHASRLHKHLDLGYFEASLFGPQPLKVSEEFPGSAIQEATYFEGPGLALLVLSDARRESIRYVVIYQVDPLRKLAVWDLGSGDLQGSFHYIMGLMTSKGTFQ